MKNNMQKNEQRSASKPRFSLHIGSASILMIFVVLCLVAFAALSTVSAMADGRLSARVMERTSAYYAACNRAEDALAETDRDLCGLFASSDSAEAYFQAAGQERSFEFPISDLQTLQVAIRIQYPEKDEDCFYRVTSWQVVNTKDLE